MEAIAKNAWKIYVSAVLFMLIKRFLPLEETLQDALSVLLLLIVLMTAAIERKNKKK
jgi:hypothetical protein